MISDRFVAFLEDKVLAFTVGTRNGELEPSVGKPAGVVITEDKKHLTFYLPEVAAGSHLENMKDNGKVSLNIVTLPSFESYQFKGDYVSHVPCDADQIDFMKKWMAKFIQGCLDMGYPESLTQGMERQIIEPAVAITFEVTEIYEQTPKPGTGNKISE